MKSLHVILAISLFACTANAVFARIVKEAEVNKLTVKYFAANGALYRVETTSRSSETTFLTIITGGDENLLGRVERIIISERALPDEQGKIYVTRNTQTDAFGNYVRTTYSIIIEDEEGKLAAITDTEGLRDATDISIVSLLQDRDFTPVTTGNF